MARPIAALPFDQLEQATAYLKRAVLRGSPLFWRHPQAIRVELSALESQLSALPAAEQSEKFRAWSIDHLTDSGRVRMLNALRRRRADANAPRTHPFVTLKLPIKTVRELKRLARQTGMSVAQLLDTFIAQLRSDASTVEHLRRQAHAADFE